MSAGSWRWMPLPALPFNIGSIDFPMPSKTPAISCRSGLQILCCQLSLELDRRQIAESRVQAFLVVDLFEKLGDRGESLSQIAIFVAQNLLVLQRFHEGFTSRVVPRVALAAHADID